MTKSITTKQSDLQPNLRFPEFQDGGDWREKRLEELYTFKSTNSLSRDKLTMAKGMVKNIHYGDIHTKFSTHFDIEKENVPHIADSEVIGKVKSDSFCVEGDVIFADASEDIEGIGKCIEIVNINKEKVLSGLHTILARQKKDCLKVGFAGYLFQSPRLRSKIQTEAQGAKVLGISGGRLASINVCFPIDKKEQQKIANCLSSLDTVIEAQGQKLDALKCHKKGLMQQLFPSEGETQSQLRFPEFLNAGEWEKRKLGDVLFPTLREIKKPDSTYLGLGVRSHGKGTFHKPNQEPTKNSMENLYLVHKDDLIVSITFAWEGAIAIAREEDHGGYVSHRFPTYEFNSNISTPHFFLYIITQKSFVHNLRLISPGGAGRNRVLSKKDFLGLAVLLPSLGEQKAISLVLSSIDDLITAQTQKLGALKRHKKGLMQQLFPAASEVQE